MFALIRALPYGLILLLASLVSTPLAAQQLLEVAQDYPGIRIEQLTDGLGIPWGMTFLSPHHLLITERAGTVQLLDIRSLSIVSVSGTPEIVAEGQGGLLDVAIGPNYDSEGWIYFTYARRVESEAATTLARARLDQARLVDWQDLLITDAATDSRQHFGSRIGREFVNRVFGSTCKPAELRKAPVVHFQLDGLLMAMHQPQPVAGDRLRPKFGRRNPSLMRLGPLGLTMIL